MKKVFVIIIIIFFKNVFAASINGSSTTTVSTQSPEARTLTTQLGLNYYEGVSQLESAPKKYFMEAALDLSMNLNSKVSTFLSTSIGKSSDEGSTTEASDVVLGGSMKGFDLSPRLKTTHTATALVPVAQNTRETERLYTSLSLINGMAWQPHAKLGLSYKLGLTQNFHEFNQNANGRANIQTRISHSLGLTWALSNEIVTSLSGAYRIGRTYEENSRYSFQTAVAIEYAISKTLSMSAGISTEGSALKPNGTDSNITLFNENTSTMRIGVSATL